MLEDRLLSAETILQKLNNPVHRLYLEFLDYVLPLFTELNCEMQAEQPKLYLLHKRISSVLHTLLESYLKSGYLKSTPLANVNVRDPGNFLPLQEIYLGGRVTFSLQGNHGIDKHELHNFRLRCLDFYIEGASQIKKKKDLTCQIHFFKASMQWILQLLHQ